ncbi:hypothetical protein ERO13_D12G107200v2 [Gossypium hirsutum]|uniref:RING-H2 finger protein ATL2 n=5 Tax=Gossypium TaxID=3633 RepID=A0A1U8NF52_GOSHI|nr:RING-H2 finger protein ATL2-like [Gossypium hirsutum]PPD77381.1 hypothetical protein GOBAR_DD25696 [Gossypium barbadense]TYG40832.1 hypothetical protein ES288_D12G125400v1 [Gossypium darwinii]TYH38688.1 hypothetical protein ES332_D12G126800v1 [Gossypium tomentosum]KAG4115483.1 hypothetical protein ERO13_D12G107200v2 [Gossypium hirsutum]TYG40833.1 hypothetical protein ES288_D12G125400v1 [Gossypium darwinii]
MMSSGMNLITTAIAFATSVIFIVFICSRIICGRIRGSQSRQMFHTQSEIDLQQAEGQTRGLEPVVVAAIPALRFNSETFTYIEDTQCSICLGDYQEKQVLRIMPKCGHNFHLSCIDLWLRKQSTCHVYRLPLQDIGETKQMRAATFRTMITLQSPQCSSSSTNSDMNT